MTLQRLGRNSVQLVRAQIKRRALGTFKHVTTQLRRRPPCELAAREVCTAFKNGELDAWETAGLLGSIRHEAGYETVCEMFSLGCGDATALMSINQARAERDLCRLIIEAVTLGARDEAARGLVQLGSPAARAGVLGASVAGLVTPLVSARALVSWGIAPKTVASWFASDKRCEAELGCVVVAVGVRRPATGPSSCPWTEEERRLLLGLAQQAVVQGQADPKPYVRTALRRPTRWTMVERLCADWCYA